ncbi:MAG: hypothetical protein ACWA6Y_10185 [Polaromonas sp.]
MRNPFLSKNPFMSAWLSVANKAAGAARGQATAAAKREVTSAQNEITKQVTDFWTGKTAAATKRKKKRS